MKRINYEGIILYANDRGEIFSQDGVKKKSYIDKQGYERVGVWLPSERKTVVVRVHTLMGMAFFDEGYSAKGLVINHKDLDKSNNALQNLELVTASQNAVHAAINGTCHKMRFRGIVGVNVNVNMSIFAWRLRELQNLGFDRKRVAKAIESGVEYKNFQWYKLEDFKDVAHD